VTSVTVGQGFLVLLFIIFMLYKAVLRFESLGEILKRNIQMEGIERYFHAVLFIML